MVLVGEVELPICQINCLEAELEERCLEPTDTVATVELQALWVLFVSFPLYGR
jgi:hypothetical protein